MSEGAWVKERGALWWLTTGVIPAGLVASIVIAPLAYSSRLPDPLATHWGSGGLPDGRLSVGGLLAVELVVSVGVWVMLIWSGRRGIPISPAPALAYFLIAIFAAAQTSIVERNLDAATWEQARPLNGGTILLVVGFAVVMAAIGWSLAGGWNGVPNPTVSGPEPSAGLDPGEGVVWMGSTHARWLLLATAAPLVAVPFAPGWAQFVLLLTALIGSLFTGVRVIVNEGGLTVGFGWWGWPRRRIALDEMSSAQVIDVRPMSFGGWGYRIVPGASAVVIRAGESLKVVRPDARDFIVTVDGAQEAAGLLNDLRRRRDPQQEQGPGAKD